MSQIIEITAEKDIDSLAHIYSTDLNEQKRIKSDFQRGYFRGLLNLTPNNELLGYLIYYNTVFERNFNCTLTHQNLLFK